MKCLLHIGTEKTATTTLQNWLYANKAELSKAKVYLSDNLGKTNNRLIPAYFKKNLDDWAMHNGVRNQVEKDKYFNGFIEKLIKEVSIAEKSHKTFIITSEHLHSRLTTKKEIEHLHSFLVSVFDKVKIVCYFRDQFDVAVSLYSTALKTDSFTDIESFVDQAKPDNYYYNYLRIADNWSEVFGKENCSFRIYDRAKFIRNDIRLDLLSLLGLDIDSLELEMTIEASNESLSLLQSAVFKVINRKIPYWATDKLGANLNNAAAKENVLAVDSLKLGKITSTKGDLIRERFIESNRIFFEKYFMPEEKFPISSSETEHIITCDQAMRAVEDAFELGFEINEEASESLKKRKVTSALDILPRLYRKIRILLRTS